MKQPNPWWITCLAICIFGALYLIVPLIAILPLSFSDDELLNYPITDYSLRWYQQILEPFPWMERLRNSLIVGLFSTVLATALGTLAAYGIFSGRFRGKGLMIALFLTPIFVPSVITGLGMFYVFSSFGMNGTFVALTLAHTVLAVPFVLITVNAVLASFDPQLVRAAKSLGAGPVAAFRQITLPLIAPGIVAGGIFAFITSFDEIVVTLFISSSQTVTLPVQLFTGLRDQMTPAIVAVAALLMIVSIALGATATATRAKATH